MRRRRRIHGHIRWTIFGRGGERVEHVEHVERQFDRMLDRSIFSDDPDAIEALTAKLAALEARAASPRGARSEHASHTV